MSALPPIATAKADMPQMVMSALPLKADMCSAEGHVCYYGPEADIRAVVSRVRLTLANCEIKRHDLAWRLREGAMITVPELAAEALGSHLAQHMRRRFGSSDAGLIEIVQSTATLALDCIGNSDALYHNVEHTMLVTLVGYDILTGRRLLTETSASDYAHILVACLFHDIGYVRGILKGDGADGYIIDVSGNKAKLPRGASDAALMPYRVDRSKLYVIDRVKVLDATRIANAIEATRFPSHDPVEHSEEGMLVRAANLIGQLGDPNYLRKANALYYEFEEIGTNKQLGYASPADLTEHYPQFYWSRVSAQIETAIRYLNITSRGRQWIANLYSNVFRAEREPNLSGPQR